MILSIITALICFVAAIIMFSSYYRKMVLLRPLAVYLIFEGIVTLLACILSDLYPTSTVSDTINCIGTIIIVAYYIFVLIMTRSMSKRKSKRSEDN